MDKNPKYDTHLCTQQDDCDDAHHNEEAAPSQFGWAGFGEGDVLAEMEENYRLDNDLFY
jgi:hypothetical protein